MTGTGDEPDNGSTGAAADASDAIQGVTGDMPTPQEHAIEAEAADESKREEAAESAGGAVDKYGRTFDPTIHKTESDGSPKLTKHGKLTIKPGKAQSAAGKQGGPSAPKSTLHNPRASRDRKASEPLDNSGDPMAAGQAIAENVFFMGQLIGGPEWAPIETWNPEVAKEYGLNERANMTQAWQNYCVKKDVRDVPAGIMVCMVIMSYASIRLNLPQTKSRMQKAKEWIATRVAKWKTRKGRKNGARSSGRDDTIGQDEHGETAGP